MIVVARCQQGKCKYNAAGLFPVVHIIAGTMTMYLCATHSEGRKEIPDQQGHIQLDARAALARFLDAIDSHNGVDVTDVGLAQLAIGTWKRQEASVKLMEKLLAEIQDDGPTDATLYAAKREVE